MKDTAASQAFKRADIFLQSSIPAAADDSKRQPRHKPSHKAAGNTVTATATTPYIPTEERSSETLACTVFSASLTGEPTTGIKLPIRNFPVLSAKLSAEAFTVLCNPSIPT